MTAHQDMNAAALLDWLRTLSHDQLVEIANMLPGEYYDRAADLTAALTRTGALHDDVVTISENHDGFVGGAAPDWLRLLGTDVTLRLAQGKIDTCLHQPGQDQVVVAAAWKPNLVVCLECEHLLRAGITGTDADNTCDRCGTVQPAGVWAVIWQAGLVLFHFGLCDGCKIEVLR